MDRKDLSDRKKKEKVLHDRRKGDRLGRLQPDRKKISIVESWNRNLVNITPGLGQRRFSKMTVTPDSLRENLKISRHVISLSVLSIIALLFCW